MGPRMKMRDGWRHTGEIAGPNLTRLGVICCGVLLEGSPQVFSMPRGSVGRFHHFAGVELVEEFGQAIFGDQVFAGL